MLTVSYGKCQIKKGKYQLTNKNITAFQPLQFFKIKNLSSKMILLIF